MTTDIGVTDSDCHDYHLEVANTGFGDMLHDTERNQKYYAALRKTIAQMHAAGREVHVLDIGTGTGILAMMAVSAGADSVTACEAFLPMANCAERIFAANNVKDKVRLIKKRSTDVEIGDGAENMRQRANLLVTEVLDTELIGEGAIGIYNHAHDTLLTEDAVCIPARASCFVQVAQSPLASQWNTFKAVANLDGDLLLKPPNEMLQCKGEAELHDVQLSQLPLEQFRPLTDVAKIFEFDFTRKRSRELERRMDINLRTTNAGSTDFVFYWWDIELDAEGEIYLSCAPFWRHPDFQAQTDKFLQSKTAGLPLPNCVPWRDHWMQAIYYIPKPLFLTDADAEFVLSCHHDEYSLWFDAFSKNSVPKRVPRHACTCLLHMTYSRSRIAQLNQTQRNKRYMRYLEETIPKTKANVLILGDGCVVGLSSARLGAENVICVEPHRFSRQFMQSLVAHNKLDNVEFVESLDEVDSVKLARLTHVFAEPYFIHSILPWDNLYFAAQLNRIKAKLPAKFETAPHSAHIYAVPVEFLDLHRIRAPVGNCEGFDLRLFDAMVEQSMALALSKIEAQPLWEYPCRALAHQQELLRVNFLDCQRDQTNGGTIEIKYNGSCNGIALWVNWHIDDSKSLKSIVSTGPTQAFEPGEFIKWDMFVRQGVQLLERPKYVSATQNQIQWSCSYEASTTQLKFEFAIDEITK